MPTQTFSRFLRRMPLWMVLIAFLLGLALAYISSFIRLGGWLYIGDILGIIGILLCFVALIVATYGYLGPAMKRLLGMEP